MSYLRSFRPMAQFFPQEQVVETGSRDEVENLPEYLRYDFGIDSVEH